MSLVEAYVNDWGETTYLPTTAGKVILGIIVVILIVAAVCIFQMTRGNNEQTSSEKKGPLTAKQIAFCAIALALGTVLSNVKVFRFPTGGSITLLSMLVIALPGFFFGLVPGLITGVAYGVLQMIIDPYILFPMQMVVDYILAFGALGLSGLFVNKKNALVKGYIAAILGRYIFAVISGWIFFGSYAWDGWSALPYSLVYNAIYIFAEAIITVVIISLPPVKKAMEKVKIMATE